MVKMAVSWIRQGSLRNKLVAASILCLLIPTCITLTVTHVWTRDAMKEQAVRNADDQLKLVEGHVMNLLSYMLHISNYIIVEPNMNTILKQQAAGKTYIGVDSEYREFEDRNGIISKIDNISIIGDKTYVTILLPNGRHFTNYPVDEFDPRLLVEAPWFEELDQLTGMEAYWVDAEPSPFRYEQREGRNQLSLARTLRRPNFEIYAYVIVTVPDQQILDIFEQLAGGQEMMLVNGEGQILAHMNRERLGDSLPYLEESASHSRIVEMEQGDFLIAERQLSVKDWRLVMLTPYEDAVHQLKKIFQSVFGIQLMTFAVFMLLLILLIRTFTRPLVRLGKLAHTVQRGNLEVRSHIRGSDEIGRLGGSFDQMLDRIKEMIKEVTAEQARKRKAELAMLQAQINPHFLFNVLGSIRMKVLGKGDKESAEMLSSLSRLLRMTIGQEDETVTVHEEVSTLIDYVKLMNMRQREKAQLHTDIALETMFAQIPRFVLQPFIENAMIHGLQQQSGTLSVASRKMEPGMMEMVLSDNGAGMDEATLQKVRKSLLVNRRDRLGEIEPRGARFSGIGLVNVAERLRIRYGDAFQLHIDSQKGKGTTVIIHMPLQEGGDSHVQSDAGRR